MTSLFSHSLQDNCVLVTSRLLQLLKVGVTKKTITTKLLEHPYHPSLLSISDVLEGWKLKVISAKVNYEEIIEADQPFITQIKVQGEESFVVVKKYDKITIQYYDQEDKLVEKSVDEFLTFWSGIVLFAEKQENSGEENYKNLKRALHINTILGFVLLAGVILGLSYSLSLLPSMISRIGFGLFSALSILGVLACFSLLWYEIDAYSPFLNRLCKTGKKVNCGAVLSSQGSKLVAGIFNWSEIGFAYFSASLLTLLVIQAKINSFFFLSSLSMLSIPFIVFSVYYQSIKIKQYCLLCMVVVGVLLAQVVVSILTTDFIAFSFILEPTIVFIFCFLMIILSWRLIKPLLITDKQKIRSTRSFNKLKNNPNVFLGLLQGSEKMQNTTDGLGIILGDKEARYKVTKVCNPYCPPCARAHPILEKLVHEGVISLQIIFTSSPEIDNRRALPTRHLMALAAKNDQNLMHKALDNWYMAKEKNYETYAHQYPLNGEVAKQTHKIKAMRDWCDLENITHTPTIYVNDHLLPKEYWVEDLIDVLV